MAYKWQCSLSMTTTATETETLIRRAVGTMIAKGIPMTPEGLGQGLQAVLERDAELLALLAPVSCPHTFRPELFDALAREVYEGCRDGDR